MILFDRIRVGLNRDYWGTNWPEEGQLTDSPGVPQHYMLVDDDGVVVSKNFCDEYDLRTGVPEVFDWVSR